MQRWSLLTLFSFLLLMVVSGCSGNRPAQTAPPPPAATTAPGANVGSSPLADPKPAPAEASPWDADLDAINRHIAQNGLLGTVYFDFDRYELRGDARAQLSRNADFIRQHPEFVFGIEGHCDERGTDEYNLALGNQRAGAAKGYLTSLGIGGERLKTETHGKLHPLCTESSETCWQRNRRAHFKVVAKSGVGG